MILTLQQQGIGWIPVSSDGKQCSWPPFIAGSSMSLTVRFKNESGTSVQAPENSWILGFAERGRKTDDPLFRITAQRGDGGDVTFSGTCMTGRIKGVLTGRERFAIRAELAGITGSSTAPGTVIQWDTFLLNRITKEGMANPPQLSDGYLTDAQIRALVTETSQTQSDWNETDSTKVDYIKNKPMIPTAESFVITATPTASGEITGTFDKTESELRAAITAGKKLIVKLTESGTDYYYTLFSIEMDTDILNIGFVRCVSGTGAPADEVLEWYSNTASYNIHAQQSEADFRLYLMPEASADYSNKLFQYCGVTSENYKEGHFYKVVYTDGSYSWQEVSLGGAVTSVNSKTGAVVLDADDVGAISRDGWEIASLAGTAVPAAGKVYEHTLAADEVFTFFTPETGKDGAFELDLTQPATAVSFTLPTVTWKFGTPDFSTGGKTYYLRFRYIGGAWQGWTAPEMSEYAKYTLAQNMICGNHYVFAGLLHDGATNQYDIGILGEKGITVGYTSTLSTQAQRSVYYCLACGGTFEGSCIQCFSVGGAQITNGYADIAGGQGVIINGYSDYTRFATRLYIGKYNVYKDLLFCAGNGTSTSSRANALELDTSGNLKLAGDLTVTENGTEVTIASLIARIEALEQA